MRLLGILLLAVLVSSILAPRAFSDDNEEKDLHGKLAFDQFSNKANSGLSFGGFSDQTTNIGQQISSFVHQAIILFKQQKVEAIKTIKECHEMVKQASPENRKQVQQVCHAKIKAIKEQFQDERKEFQELFKQFRQNIIEENFDRSDLEINHSIKTGHKQHDLN